MLAGQKVWRKYRQASVRMVEYRRLKAMVPSIAKKRKVSKVRCEFVIMPVFIRAIVVTHF